MPPEDLQAALEAGLDEGVQATVQHCLGVSRLHTGAQILDAGLVEHIGTDLTAPADIRLAVLDRLLIGAALAGFFTLRGDEGAAGDRLFARFIVDQMPGAFGKPAADFAFINSGSLRIDDTVAGDITFEDIARTFGFSSFLRYVTLTGAEFRQLMEAGFRGDGTSQGYFPQISGFRVCVDRSRETLSRIVSLQLPGDEGWKEIEADREYGLVLPDFLYRGGDGYTLPEGRQGSRTGAELKYRVLDAILRAQGAGQPVGVPVDPAAPRIEVAGRSMT